MMAEDANFTSASRATSNREYARDLKQRPVTAAITGS
jgi:hypothetical protein